MKTEQFHCEQCGRWYDEEDTIEMERLDHLSIDGYIDTTTVYYCPYCMILLVDTYCDKEE